MESATATARCACNTSSLKGCGCLAKGCCGATANTKPTTVPISAKRKPGVVVLVIGTPMAKSAWPEVRLYKVPLRVSWRSLSRVGGLAA